MVAKFIGREKELKKLSSLTEKKTSSLIVVKGRRRIGKSRLIQEFGKFFDRMYSFSGIPPTEKTTHADQLNEFGWQLGKALDQPAFKDDNWNDLFLRLAKHTRKGRVLILFDEISWMGSKDANFLGKLKNAWDLEFKKNNQLIMVLCGSVSAWIDENILNSTGFVGRISYELTLEELTLADCNEFWSESKTNISAFEKFKVLSVTGGIPKYLEEIQIRLPAEENVKSLCFDRGGFLFNEFNQIFTDIFSKRSDIYKRIIESIVEGKYELNEIYKNLKVEKSGAISKYLEDLIKSGFVRRDYTWDIKNKKISKLSRYRISDNYLRFYLKYISPNREKVEKGSFKDKSITSLADWDSAMGLQFENLVLNNRDKIKELLQINPNDVINDNPFFQNEGVRQKSCQIDYMIQTRFDTLYICEIKFRRDLIRMDIIKEIKEKIYRLKAPRYVSFRPVLIHVNGVDKDVLSSEYFSNIIDFSELLEAT